MIPRVSGAARYHLHHILADEAPDGCGRQNAEIAIPQSAPNQHSTDAARRDPFIHHFEHAVANAIFQQFHDAVVEFVALYADALRNLPVEVHLLAQINDGVGLVHDDYLRHFLDNPAQFFRDGYLAGQDAPLDLQALADALLGNFVQQFILVLVVGVDELLGHLKSFGDVVQGRALISFFIEKAAGCLDDTLSFKRDNFALEG